MKNLNHFFTGYYLSGSFRVIDGAMVSRYREWRKTVPLPPRNAVATPTTIKRELAVASAACNFCRAELNWDIPNPFQGRLMSRVDAKSVVTRKRVLTASEEAAILLACPPLARDIAKFALLTGFRQGEILGLTWDRVIGDVVIFTPDDQKSRKFGKRVLSEEALAILNRQDKRGIYVFHVEGQKLRKETLGRWWRKARAMVGLEDVKFHDTRKTAGQKMLDAGASLEGVQAQLGHDDIRTTQKWYVDPSVEMARDAVRRIAKQG
jgi:integrase